MAEVEYKHQPTVSVHGIPREEYDASVNQPMNQPITDTSGVSNASGDVEQGGQQYSGIAGHFRRHWVMYSLGLAAAGVFVAYLAYRRSNSANTYAVTTGNSSTGQVGTPSTIDSSWGSQLDADYQQLTSVETTNTGLLQSILNGITGGTTGTPKPNPPPGTSPGMTPQSPIMGNQPIHNPMLGEQFSFEGILYQLVPGSSNRVWGVQENAGHPYSSQQLKDAPIGFGVGQKRLLTTGG
jgi:hypothetical protein